MAEPTTTKREQAQRVIWRGYHPTDLQAAISAGYAALALALVRRAIRDAAGLDIPTQTAPAARAELIADAQDWLTSAEGLGIAEYAGFDAELIKRWAAIGYPADIPGERQAIHVQVSS